MDVREVAVVGLGTMGAGIAEVFARSGIGVVAIEADPGALARGMATVRTSLGKAVSRGRLTGAAQEEILTRIRPAESVSAAAGAGLVIEVVPERLDIKRQVFDGLDQACGPDTIFATNTSSLSVTEIAAGTRDPGRVVGMHFFNPAPVMRLVEVVTTVRTSPGTGAAVTELARRLGKTPVQVTDRAGFIANALLLPYLNHAARLLESGYATGPDIDAAATAGIGLPMGPLALLDLIGLDTSLSILDVLHGEFGGTRYAAAPLLRRLVAAGLTGRKAGRGVYDYSAGRAAGQPGSVPPGQPGHGQAGQPGGGQAGQPGGGQAGQPGGGQGGQPGGGQPGGGLAGDSGPGPAAGVVRLLDARAAEGGRAGPAAGDPVAELIRQAGWQVTGPGETGVVSGAANGGAGNGGAANGGAGNGGAGGLILVRARDESASVLSAALATGRPADVVGLHLAGDDLAELIATPVSGPGAVEAAGAVAAGLGRTVVWSKDRPGFLAGALLYPHLNDAARMVQDGYAAAADIDTAMTLGCGYPRGPLALLDQAGPGRVVAVLTAMHERYGDPAFAPVPLLAEHASAGLAFC
ncbi:MAG TPA: 3-hydroxyacyl-CoA dehydrogenase NAD-binding domain-containing protein [Streptosporangiaceae bacterium]|jgi:3-hydroxybutyryl-CoA dehydrogenase